jgi:hypothetical protein
MSIRHGILVSFFQLAFLGGGPTIIDKVVLPGERSRVVSTHQGEGNFIVWAGAALESMARDCTITNTIHLSDDTCFYIDGILKILVCGR